MKKSRKQGLLLLCLLLMLSIVMSACGNEGAGDQSGGSKKGVKLRLAYWGAEFAQAQKVEQTYKKIFDDYKAKTGHEVEFVFIPDNNYRTWMVTQQAAGSMPEVVATRMAWVWEDYAKKQVIDLSPYMEKESAYNPGKPWKQTFLPSFYKDSINPANGILNSAPAFTAMIRILYNKDLFAKAGIDKAPQTWPEFIEVSKKLKQAGITPIAMSGQSNSHISWFLTSIFGQLDEQLRLKMDTDGDNMVIKNELARATDAGLIDYTKYPFRDGIELFKDFSQYWNSDFNGIDEKTAEQMWLTGKTAMLIFNSSQLSVVEEMQGRKFEYGGFPIPYITKKQFPEAMEKSVMLGGAANESWAVSTSAKDDKLAASIDLIQYLTSPEVQGYLADKLSYLPTITNANLPEKLKGFVMQNEDIRRANYTGPATIKEFSDFLIKSMQLYLGGSVSTDKLTQELNAEWRKGMDTAKKTNDWTKDNNYGMKKP
ncbi:ABC transporter substrate-binding protein [Paenibacillus sp. GCM10023248]|uniref:ABC transporter substrate-binding protein n=1 Tax=unclassified Paenibacillus TaxID=185978 RepID=UPI002378BC59|nr:extracellular solute-binding protein [Paenibacillus sp. MAHUQ-63]MDD9269435.1 extracellular solute-binding protein [Paenibacillus sp. MAHUQ-63]